MNSGEREKSDSGDAPFFTGLFHHEIDLQGRVAVPEAWKLRPGDTLYGLPWPLDLKTERCIFVMTSSSLSEMRSQMAALPATDPEAANLRRILGGNLLALQIEPGREITLPEALLREAGLTSEAVLVGLLDYFQIWEPRRYEDRSARDADLTRKAFQSIASLM